MHHRRTLFIPLFCLLLSACSPVKLPQTTEYRLFAFGSDVSKAARAASSILVSQPDAVAGYQTSQMLYVNKPYTLSAFAHNAWVSPPADMLFPLIVQSLQKSGQFYAVASTPYAPAADYRLDTQLLRLEQNFLQKPSVVELSVKVVLTRTSDNKVLASRILSIHEPAHAATPFGGAEAANRATTALTTQITRFVLDHTHNSRPLAK